MLEILLILGVVLAVAYTVMNGFHDASNAAALPVRFRAMSPAIALWMGAVFNVLGVCSVGLVLTQVLSYDIPLPHGTVGVAVLICALVTTLGWNYFTWWRAMPSSSTAAIGGGIVGATWGAQAVGLHATDPALVSFIWGSLIVPLVVAPVAAYVLAWALVGPVVYLFRNSTPSVVSARSRVIQATGAAAIHFGHGIQHGRRSIWIFAALFMASGVSFPLTHIPVWIVLVVALALATGTLFGGWRIAHTLSSRVVNLDPLRGAVAQSVSGGLLFFGSFLSPIAMSTSQTSTAAILGAGTSQRFRSVQHGVLLRILLTWVSTIPVCAVISAVLLLASSPVLETITQV